MRDDNGFGLSHFEIFNNVHARGRRRERKLAVSSPPCFPLCVGYLVPKNALAKLEINYVSGSFFEDAEARVKKFSARS